MRDITLEDTIYFNFTTRSFTTGVPTVLAGTPVLSVLESNNATPITAGVSVSVDRASVVGLNQGTVVATAANGYEAGKSYCVYISTGTVGGVSVVGETVFQFTIQASAAAVDLANATDGLGALKTEVGTRMATYTQPTGFLAATFPGTVASTTNITAAAGVALSSEGITAIWAEVITGTTTAVQAMRGFIAAMLGKASGLETTTAVYRNIADTKNVVSATVDADGNRTAVTLDLT